MVVPGDGIRPEIVKEAAKVLDVTAKKYGHRFVYTKVDAGGCAIGKHRTSLLKESLNAALISDSVLLGAVSGPKQGHIDPSIRPEEVLLGIRKELGPCANLRSTRIFKELSDASPLRRDTVANGIDSMVVRELIGGVYLGEKSMVEKNGKPYASDNMCHYAHEIERIAHMTFQTVRKKEDRVISVDEANVLGTSRLWYKIVSEVAKEYSDATLTRMLVDDAAMQIVKDPSQFDAIATESTFGDILGDEASMITGSVGLIPSASLGEIKRGMYEPIHSSMPDIAGQNTANPVDTMLVVDMMLKHTSDMDREVAEIGEAVEAVLRLGYRTKDIMEDRKTYRTCPQVGDTIAELTTNVQEM